jgi:O-antigen/teichoic acid export membrane protein
MIKKILNNATLMSWLSYFVQFGSLLFVFPLLITVYTPLEQSFWWLINTLVGFALLADSGFGSVLVRGVSYFKAGADYLPRTKEEYNLKVEFKSNEPNLNKLADLLTTTNRIYLLLSLLLVVLMIFVGPAIIWNVMKLSGHRIDFWLAYFILIPNCVYQILTVRWRSFLRGLDYIAKEARINTITGVLRLIAFIAVLSFKLPPLYLVICIFLETFGKYWYLRHLVLSWFRSHNKPIVARRYFDKEIFKSLWTATWKVGLIQWGNYFISSGNSIIIAQVRDPILMAAFLLTSRLLDAIANIATITLYSNIPTIYSLAAKKNMKEIKIMASGFMFLGILLMVIACFLVAVFGNWGLSLLNKETQLVPIGLFVLMAFSQLLEMHTSYHAGIYTSTNHIPFLVPTIITGAVIIGVGFYVMPIYGLLGIILTRFLAQSAFNNWYAVSLSLKLLDWPLKKYIVEFPVLGINFITGRIRLLFGKD